MLFMNNEKMFKSEEQVRNLHKKFGTELRGFKKVDVINALKSLSEEWGMAVALLSKNGIDLNIQDFYGGEAFSAPVVDTNDFMQKFAPNLNQSNQDSSVSSNEIEALKKENAYLSENNLSKHLEIEKLNETIKELTSELQGLSGNQGFAPNDSATFNDDINILKNELSLKDAKIKELEDDLIACANSVSETENEEIKALVDTVQEQDAEITKMREEIKVLSELSKNANSEEIATLLEQIDSIKKEHENEISNYADTVSSLEETIASKEEIISSLTAEKEQLSAELFNAENNSVTNEELDVKLQKIQSLESVVLEKEAKIQNELIEIQRVKDIMMEKERVLVEKENIIAQNKELVSENYLETLQEKELSLEKANKRMDTMISIAEQAAEKMKVDAEEEANSILAKAEENKNKILEEARAIEIECKENMAKCESEIKELKEKAIAEANSITENAEKTATKTIENAEKIAIESQEKAKEKIAELTSSAQDKLDAITKDIETKENELQEVKDRLAQVKTDCLDELQQIQFKIEKVVVDYQ